MQRNEEARKRARELLGQRGPVRAVYSSPPNQLDAGSQFAPDFVPAAEITGPAPAPPAPSAAVAVGGWDNAQIFARDPFEYAPSPPPPKVHKGARQQAPNAELLLFKFDESEPHWKMVAPSYVFFVVLAPGCNVAQLPPATDFVKQRKELIERLHIRRGDACIVPTVVYERVMKVQTERLPSPLTPDEWLLKLARFADPPTAVLLKDIELMDGSGDTIKRDIGLRFVQTAPTDLRFLKVRVIVQLDGYARNIGRTGLLSLLPGSAWNYLRIFRGTTIEYEAMIPAAKFNTCVDQATLAAWRQFLSRRTRLTNQLTGEIAQHVREYAL